MRTLIRRRDVRCCFQKSHTQFHRLYALQLEPLIWYVLRKADTVIRFHKESAFRVPDLAPRKSWKGVGSLNSRTNVRRTSSVLDESTLVSRETANSSIFCPRLLVLLSFEECKPVQTSLYPATVSLLPWSGLIYPSVPDRKHLCPGSSSDKYAVGRAETLSGSYYPKI